VQPRTWAIGAAVHARDKEAEVVGIAHKPRVLRAPSGCADAGSRCALGARGHTHDRRALAGCGLGVATEDLQQLIPIQQLPCHHLHLRPLQLPIQVGCGLWQEHGVRKLEAQLVAASVLPIRVEPAPVVVDARQHTGLEEGASMGLQPGL
jgi:hypothetical protein